MRKRTTNASMLAYIGVILLVAGLYPWPETLMDQVPVFHALWHLMLFIGASLLIYGLETLRGLARRHHRMIS